MVQKRETKTEARKRVSSKFTCLPSCAGCAFHEMALAGEEYQPKDESGRTLFNHWCVNPKYREHSGDGIAPTFELTERIAPPQPAWCKEDRPTFQV